MVHMDEFAVSSGKRLETFLFFFFFFFLNPTLRSLTLKLNMQKSLWVAESKGAQKE